MRALAEASDRSPEIWVDATVLKCCNQAFDLAVAHRAPEVRLEHLVHAMTLVPEAVQILQEAGISDATLRRESGVIIAHDIPSVSPNGTFTPKTSEEMEDVLRLAAETAYQHRSPVAIDDILQTLFDMKRDLPTHNLLSRHRSDWTLREPVEHGRRRYESAPRGRAQIEPPSMTDTAQNSRIDQLERVVSDLVATLRSPTHVSEEASEPARPSGHANGNAANGVYVDIDRLLDRIQEIDSSVDRKFRELARTWNVLGERLQTVEDILLEADTNGDGSIDREEWARLTGRLDRLQVLEALPKRLEALEHLPARLERIDGFASRLGRLDEVFAKLERIEPVVAKLDNMQQVLSKLDRLDRLDMFDDVDRKLTAVEQTFARVLQRLDGMEERLEKRVGGFDLGPVQDKLRDIDNAIARGISVDIDTLDILERFKDVISKVEDQGLMLQTYGERFDKFDSSIAGSLNAQQAAAERMRATLEQGLRTVSTGNVDTGLIAEAVQQPVARTLADVKAIVEQDRREQREQFEVLVKGIDRNVGEYRNDLNEVHEAMLKLNGNQQTFAQSLDQWRGEIASKLTTMLERIETVEKNAERRMQTIDDLRERVDVMTTTTVREASHDDVPRAMPYDERPDSFVMWLFGTDNWWSDGWRSPEERAELRRREQAGAGYTGYQQDPTQRRLHG